jgi:molybdopterin-guanine dinucleotide biosynthesis protein A
LIAVANKAERQAAAGVPARIDSLTGVVLCGGASRRMAGAGDKALLRVGERTLLEDAAAVLGGVSARVLLACGAERRYAELGLELVLDAPWPDAGDEEGAREGDDRGPGPLAGLLAALEAAGTEWLAVLACDMPRAQPGILRRLHDRAVERDLDACLFETEAGVEPLFAVYRRSCSEPIRRALAAGRRRLVAFHDEISVATLREAELEPALRARDCARNLNTPADLARERAGGGDR